MAIPNFQTIDLASIRENSPQPTSDVKFIFANQDSGEKLELDAHKLILAFGSEVFMTQFFGSFKEDRDIIPVEDVSFEAFKIFLDVLYNKKISLRHACFKILAELYYLADKYLMAEMKELIIKKVSSRKMFSGKLIEAAKVAEENAHMEKFSESILHICSTFIKDDLKSVLNIFHREEAGSENSLILHRLLGKASQILSEICENCEHSPCLRGEQVTEDNFVQNAQVNYTAPTGKEKKEECKVVVKDVEDDEFLLLASCPNNTRNIKVFSMSGCKYDCIKRVYSDNND